MHAQYWAPGRVFLGAADGVVENNDLLDSGDGCSQDGFGVGVVDAFNLFF